MPWDDLQGEAVETSVIGSDWAWISPLGWTPDGIRFVFSKKEGNLAWTTEWLVSPGTRSGQPTALELAPICDGASVVAMDADGDRLVCTEWHFTTDIWRLELP